MNSNTPEEPRALPPARPRIRRVPAPETVPSTATETAPAAAEPRTYEVGYGKPPKHTQFQKGVSGNPAGRPRGNKGIKTIVREQMTEKVEVRTPSGTRKITRMEALMLRSIEAAFKGNVRMAAWLAAQYAAAVPEASTDASAPHVEDLTATDLAMLEALRESLIGLGDVGGEADPDTPAHLQADGEIEHGPEPTISDRPPKARPHSSPTDDYDWDRRLV